MNQKYSYLRYMIENGSRLGNRKLNEYRKIEVKVGVISKAEGSAIVKIGNTEVIVGVKMDVLQPFQDTPKEGILIVNSELYPIASSAFELGPPSEDAIELARIVDRGVRESNAIDMEKLCIVEGEKVWGVFVDIQPINHDGNIIDASGIATIAALLNAKIPKYEDGKVIYEEKKKKLPIRKKPIPVTIGFIKNRIIVDPDAEEEKIIDSRITITTTDNAEICAIQKGGSGTLNYDNICEAFDISIALGKKIRSLL